MRVRRNLKLNLIGSRRLTKFGIISNNVRYNRYMARSPDRLRTFLPETDKRLSLIHAEIKKVIPGPVRAYYPGIGGGEEFVDPLSAFVYTGADSVFGVDTFEHPEGSEELGTVTTTYDFRHVGEEIVKHLSDNGFDPKIAVQQDDKFYTCSFEMNGRSRELKIRKTTTNALEFVPPEPFNLVYSKRTVGIVGNLPPRVLEEARVLFFIGEGISDANEVQNAGEQLGFRNIDLAELTRDNRKFYKSKFLIK